MIKPFLVLFENMFFQTEYVIKINNIKQFDFHGIFYTSTIDNFNFNIIANSNNPDVRKYILQSLYPSHIHLNAKQLYNYVYQYRKTYNSTTYQEILNQYLNNFYYVDYNENQGEKNKPFIKKLNYSIYSITSDGIYNKKHQDFTLNQNSFSSKVHQCVLLINKSIIDEFLHLNKVEV